jgi:hypothetical protein
LALVALAALQQASDLGKMAPLVALHHILPPAAVAVALTLRQTMAVTGFLEVQVVAQVRPRHLAQVDQARQG